MCRRVAGGRLFCCAPVFLQLEYFVCRCQENGHVLLQQGGGSLCGAFDGVVMTKSVIDGDMLLVEAIPSI